MDYFRPSATAFAGAVVLCVLAGFNSPAGAQEVDIFYDEYGRRILLDPYTGEVLRVEPPRRMGVRRADRYRYPDQEDLTYGVPEEYPLDEDERLYGRIVPPPPYPGDEPPIIRLPEEYSPPVEERASPSIERAPLAEPQQAAIAPSMADPDLKFDQVTASRSAIAALQVVLDRVGASPGVIDGRMGDNVAKAIEAYRTLTGVTIDPSDEAVVEALLEETGGPATSSYTITQEDVSGPFIPVVPVDYSEKAALQHMSYTSTLEKLAERFHMDEDYLKALNPGADFNYPGTQITVANIKRTPRRPVERIVADKRRKQVLAYDGMGGLVAAYPATIGSAQTPSPSGNHEVVRVAFDPEYTYNPKINFKQGNNDRILRIPPGPNGPVGSIWIALSKPTYGIHGTPDPSRIGKTNSNGCVRLTNWDARELAKLVKPGVSVEFVD
jgi:lipoprotein-anchoring transpeptidase ErfK/SrfK